MNAHLHLEKIVRADLAATTADGLLSTQLFCSIPGAKAEDAADKTLKRFINLEFDDEATSQISRYRVVKVSEAGEGVSTKIANIKVNWRELRSEIPSFALTGASSATDVYIFCLALIVLIGQLKGHTHLKLSDEQVRVVLSLVKASKISESSPKKIKRLTGLDEKAIEEALKVLIGYGIVGMRSGNIYLIEEVKIRN